MATTMDTHNLQQLHKKLTRGFNASIRHLLEEDGESAGYVVYLTERELFEAYPRAKRENPDALVHFERHDDDVWSLEVYKSEAAKCAMRINFYCRQRLLSRLTLIGCDKRPCHA